MKTEHLAHFFIAGFTYYDGALVFRKLKIGKKLRLELEEDNKYDHRAVAVYYKKHKIGFIPRTENRIFYKLLKIGLGENIRMTVQSTDRRQHPESQVQIVAHLINKNEQDGKAPDD
ncbi:MAG: HIRAN domain-containing protein [Weeksellaceae bacterium]|nr:HIRAN domain-containing protein [Weeksellaceae bacterium]